jgi:hypothetical protein
VAVGADSMSAELIAEILSETPIEIWENRLKKIKNTQNPILRQTPKWFSDLGTRPRSGFPIPTPAPKWFSDPEARSRSGLESPEAAY